MVSLRRTHEKDFHCEELSEKMGEMVVDPCDTPSGVEPLLSLEMAWRRLEACLIRRNPSIESCSLVAAYGRRLGQKVSLDRHEPPVSRSAMDGFAVVAADGVGLRSLEDSVFAGTTKLPQVTPGVVAAVMTGGSIPPGADAVVPVEQTERKGEQIMIQRAPQLGAHIRVAGEMGSSGKTVLAPGVRLRAGELAVLAGCGQDPVKVFARPKVHVLATGDEVVPWDAQPNDHQVRDSNRLACMHQVESWGGQVASSARVADDPTALLEAVASCLESGDLVITIGGVSKGDRDHLPEVFAQLGVDRLFHGLSVQPGKPVWMGERNGAFVVGLPGNPVSTFVMMELLAKFLLRALGGGPVRVPRLEWGCLRGTAQAKKRERFMPATLVVAESGEVQVQPLPGQGSGDWTALAHTRALLHVPSGAALAEGDPVNFVRLEE